MFEKVNPSHPDKVADRIAGAMVDVAYAHQNNPKVAVEVLIGHGDCNIIVESSYTFKVRTIARIVKRIVGYKMKLNLIQVPQDPHLADNQKLGFKCGDNGIFKGVPPTKEQKKLATLVRRLYKKVPYDGKFIINEETRLITSCQSNIKNSKLKKWLFKNTIGYRHIINPLGEWTGGINTDTGATNRKLGSDMGDAVTGGGLHGKDLSKADVSVNIYCGVLAIKHQQVVTACCSIGDTFVRFSSGEIVSFTDIVNKVKEYIDIIGGFEKLAEWGLI